MSVRRRGGIAAAVLGLLAASALGATPASASTSQGLIAGAGVVTNDWGDEGPLSSSNYSHSSATKLWQMVLWAEQAKESDGSVFDASDIDCQFGPNTTYATKDLQRRWGLTADGIVGPNTFGRADNQLKRGPEAGTWLEYVGYWGNDRVMTFQRSTYADGPGGYYVSSDADSYRLANYKDAAAC